MLEQIKPQILAESGDQLPERVPLPEPQTKEQQLQLIDAFDKLASVLRRVEWSSDDIDRMMRLVYGQTEHVAIDDMNQLLSRLNENMPYVQFRGSDKIVWDMWSKTRSIEELVLHFDDDQRHDVHHLRMHLARIVADIAKQTI